MGRLIHEVGNFKVYQAGKGAIISHDLVDYKDFHYHIDNPTKAILIADLISKQLKED